VKETSVWLYAVVGLLAIQCLVGFNDLFFSFQASALVMQTVAAFREWE